MKTILRTLAANLLLPSFVLLAVLASLLTLALSFYSAVPTRPLPGLESVARVETNRNPAVEFKGPAPAWPLELPPSGVVGDGGGGVMRWRMTNKEAK